MKGRAIAYSSDELAWLSGNRTLPIQDYTSQFCSVFQRDVSPKNLHALRKRKGWKTGRTGQFAKGAVPSNKGTKYDHGVGGRHPNAVRTQFKHGGRTGKAAQNYKPVGTERISADGYRERKIHDGQPFHTRWQLVHRLEWEAVHGPVPQGMALKCLADRSDVSPENWTLVPRAMLPRLNGGRAKKRIAYDDAPAEIKPTLMSLARLEHQLHTTKKAGGVAARAPASVQFKQAAE